MSIHNEQQLANALRFLSIDAVQKANSGHPGMPLGMADIAEVLWRQFLKHNPSNPNWVNRDRFVLSNGHGCMLLYAALHLSGYDLSIEDLKQFRQLHSRTPGHPEYGYTPGVETTTGPLGQGLANAVGMAIAETHLAAEFNQPDFNLVDYYTYCFVGDGCLMEGISHEACSLAGTLKLGKLIVFYDDNGISIDGKTADWFSDNTPQRFAAYHWHVIENIDGHDHAAIAAAIQSAQQVKDKPTLICCRTTIGWGSPHKANSPAAHGAPLGQDEINLMRDKLEWPHAPFVIPNDIYAAWNHQQLGQAAESEWQQCFQAYTEKYPRQAAAFLNRIQGNLPSGWQLDYQHFIQSLVDKKLTTASRKASQLCLNFLAPKLPCLFGGSADLTESNCTNWDGMQVYSSLNPAGRYLYYGVREFAMSAIMNGLALSKAILPFGGTFLTFSDYARNAIRLAALMRNKVVFVYSHDSIGLGEDGPTHQPVEQLPSLRAMPHLSVWRPADAIETAIAWQAAILTNGPTCLLLSRQNLPHLERSPAALQNISKGGYVVWQKNDQFTAILIATGSEVTLAIDAAEDLAQENIFVRVVSMPSVNTFLAQSTEYQANVLPPDQLARVAIEAAAGDDWYRFVGLTGHVIGIQRFGASAPASAVYRDCGITKENICLVTKNVVHKLEGLAR